MLICTERRGLINMRINEKNYVDKAEKVISDLAEESKVKNRGRVNIVTTSKLRNLLAMTADIYNQYLHALCSSPLILLPDPKLLFQPYRHNFSHLFAY